MRIIIFIFFSFHLSLSLAQDDDCKKLRSKKNGASSNDCCIDEAATSDNLLILSQNEQQKRLTKVHAPFGLPKSKNKHIHILYSPGYICGYDTVLHLPIWIQYKFWKADLWNDSMRRTDCFRQDPRLDIKEQISHADFTRSGFDRGHLKPANDAKRDKNDHLNSFVMTNMAPQYPNMNRREWLAIECYLNALSRKDSIDRAYMITGSIVDDNPEWINDKIAIPSWFYKIYFFKTKKRRWDYWVFYVKNDNVKSDIREFEAELKENLKTIDELESLTQTNFFVASKGQRAIEKRKNSAHIWEGMFQFGYSSSYIKNL